VIRALRAHESGDYIAALQNAQSDAENTRRIPDMCGLVMIRGQIPDL